MLKRFVEIYSQKNFRKIKFLLDKANYKKSVKEYIYQTFFLTIFSFIFFEFLIFLIFKEELLLFFYFTIGNVLLSYLSFHFWINYVNVLIRKLEREQQDDLLFVLEFFLVSIKAGILIPEIIEDISKLNRGGSIFFKRILQDLKSGTELDTALKKAVDYSASSDMKIFLKRIRDSINIGTDINTVLEELVEEVSIKKTQKIKEYSKKINPLITIYMMIGIVMPSLGITFLILFLSFLEITTIFLNLILFLIFIVIFIFQYITYTSFKFLKINV